MPFDEDPKQDVEVFPCNCGGEITFNNDSMKYECNKCDFSKDAMKEEE